MQRLVQSRATGVLAMLAVFAPSMITGCATGQTRHATSVVDYLYPDTKEPVVTPTIPVLSLPVRVGIAFVPGEERGRTGRFPAFGRVPGVALTETKKVELMKEVAEHFKKYDFVKSIEIIPSAYLTPKGSFTNLNQLRTMYGVDVIALLSYDQVQFTAEGALSFTYWTIIGAYVVPGEKNDTHTMLDAIVYDIASRKMLFRAPGVSHIKGHATPVNLSEQLRKDSEQGFRDAAKQMVGNLDQQLALFKDKVKSSPQEYKVVHRPGYGTRSGGGGLDGLMLALVIAMGGVWWWTRRAHRRR